MNQGGTAWAFQYMTEIMTRQGLPPINSSTEFRDAVAERNPEMISGTVPGMDPLQ